MGDCCVAEAQTTPVACMKCGRKGRRVEPITLKALLRPEALLRLGAPEHRFCATPDCPVVYFGQNEVFVQEDVLVKVFQKEPVGDRMVCYCFGETEGDIRDEVRQTGRSTAAERINELVAAGRCACELRNPQGSCCLGNIALTTKSAMDAAAVSRG